MTQLRVIDTNKEEETAMPATKTQPAAREAYLAAVDELVARLGRAAALHFMKQATSAVAYERSPVTSAQTRDLHIRQRSDVFAEALEAARS